MAPLRWDSWEQLLLEYEHWYISRRLAGGRISGPTMQLKSDLSRAGDFAEWSGRPPAEANDAAIHAWMHRPRHWHTPVAQMVADANAVYRVLAFGRGLEDVKYTAIKPSQHHLYSPIPSERSRRRDSPEAPRGQLTPSPATLEQMLAAPSAKELECAFTPQPVSEVIAVNMPPTMRPEFGLAGGGYRELGMATGTALSWEQLLSAFLTWRLGNGLSAATVDSDRRRVSTFAAHVHVQPAAVTAQMIASYLEREGVAEWTMKSAQVSLRALFGFAREQGLLPSNPMDGLLLSAGGVAIPAPALVLGSVDARRRGRGSQAVPGIQFDLASFDVHPARVWARTQGYRVGETGSLSPVLLRAWQAAGSPVMVGVDDDALAAWDGLLMLYAQKARASGRATSTIAMRKRHAKAFARWSRTRPQDVTWDQLVMYLANPHWKQETRRANRASLAVVFAFAHKAGIVQINPAEDLEHVAAPVGVPRPAPEAVLEQAVARCSDPRTRLMLLLGALQGMRRAEIASLRCEDITAQGLRITGKGSKTRLIPVHPAMDEELAPYVDGRGWVFPNQQNPGEHLTPDRVGRLISRALPKGWTAHTLRHRFATQAFGGTRDLRATQLLLGHSSPTVTARYVAVTEAALAVAVGAVPAIGNGITSEPPAMARSDTSAVHHMFSNGQRFSR